MLSPDTAAVVSRGQWIAALTLLGALVVLGVGGLLAWIRKWRPVAPAVTDEPRAPIARSSTAELSCPACSRRYPLAARFCAVDATPLLRADSNPSDHALVCPRCDVSYDDGVRFCPVDAEELVRAIVDPTDEQRHHHADGLAGSDKICPVCAARYEVQAAYCGRDGTRLLPLH